MDTNISRTHDYHSRFYRNITCRFTYFWKIQNWIRLFTYCYLYAASTSSWVYKVQVQHSLWTCEKINENKKCWRKKYLKRVVKNYGYWKSIFFLSMQRVGRQQFSLQIFTKMSLKDFAITMIALVFNPQIIEGNTNTKPAIAVKVILAVSRHRRSFFVR